MALPTLKITISSTGDVNVTPNAVIQKRYVGWRCLHQEEGGLSNPDGQPVVRPSENAVPVLFTEAMQKLSFCLNEFNPLFTANKWLSVYDYKAAFTNGNGFGDESDPRADYINRVNLTKPLPKLMKAIICGGMFIRGQVVGSSLVCYPGVHAIDASKPIPSTGEVLAKNWYYVATTAKRKPDGTWAVNNFPQGSGQNVLIPYILKEPVVYPLAWFKKWEEDSLPNPLFYY
jgi:hypothetical protein